MLYAELKMTSKRTRKHMHELSPIGAKLCPMPGFQKYKHVSMEVW